MKLKKIIAIMILTIIFISQVSFISVNNFVYAKDTSTKNENNFHYSQLTETAKSIYNGMYDMYVKGILKTGTQDYDLAEHGYFTESQIKEYEKGSSELKEGMNAARYAFYADYPEIFYVDFPKLTLRTTKGADGSYHIYLGSGRNENYFTKGFSNQEQVENAINEFDARVNEIVQGANSLEIKEGKNKKAEQVRYVHDEIINNTSYRLEDTCHDGNDGFLGTPYGILVKKQGVCEGYARALKAVLDKLEINCILVQGVNQYPGEAPVAHMWNYVQIEETIARQAESKWYAVDATQDDPYIEVAPQKDRVEYLEHFDSYGKEGFESSKYLLAGQVTMNERHITNSIIEAAGDYEFQYPELADESYGARDVSNADGLSVTYNPDYKDSTGNVLTQFKISYKGMGAAKSIEQGIYMLAKYYRYDEEEDSCSTTWAYILPEYYALDDYDEFVNIYENQAMYMAFAITNKKPIKTDEPFSELRYQGDEKDILAKTEKIFNKNSGYVPPPYIKTQTPSPSGTITRRNKPFHVTAVWDEVLEPKGGLTAEDVGYQIECRSFIGSAVSGAEYSKIENFTWNGTDKVEFDITFSAMYADDNIQYLINITGLVGERSKKTPNPISLSVRNYTECPSIQAARGSWDLYAKPTLLESGDLSTKGWKTENGDEVSEKLSGRIALVTTNTTQQQTDKMEELMEEKFPNQEVVSSKTYNITLTVCRSKLVQTGHKVKLKVGFPDGCGPEKEGVTYKAYHFIRNKEGEVIDVEEIDCVVTQYGLVITCDSFSPFAIVAVEDDGTSTTQQNKSIIATSTDGGKITTENLGSANIIELAEGESEKINIKPDEGYEIESITVCGNTIEVTNKDAMDITVKYEDVQNANNIVNVNFVAKTVAQKEEERQEEPVQPTADPAEITMPEDILTSIKQTVKITPTITETAGIQTYQWYKDDQRLEGKTNRVLEINDVNKNDSGAYKLEVTSTIYTSSVVTTSEPCTVTVASFETSMTKSTDKTLYPGEEFEVTVNINGFQNIPKGLIALGGQLEYNSNILEKIDITEQNGWDMDGAFNDENFKFVIDNNKYIIEDGDIFKIKFKVKETITEATSEIIKIKNIVASNAGSDIASNDAEITVNIQKAPVEITSDKYLVEDGFISRIDSDTTVSIFKTNIKTSGNMIIKDAKGNILGDEDFVGTGSILQVGEDTQFTLVVIGDLNGDGKITVTDIAKLKLHSIEVKEEMLTGASLKAADLNGNNEVTITDLAQLKLLWLDKQD